MVEGEVKKPKSKLWLKVVVCLLVLAATLLFLFSMIVCGDC